MLKLSPSTLSILEDCERCFWLQFKAGLKRKKRKMKVRLSNNSKGFLNKNVVASRKALNHLSNLLCSSVDKGARNRRDSILASERL